MKMDKYCISLNAKCPRCDHRIDIEKINKLPEEGDFSVCVCCGNIMQFRISLGLVNSSVSEFSKLSKSAIEKMEIASRLFSELHNACHEKITFSISAFLTGEYDV